MNKRLKARVSWAVQQTVIGALLWFGVVQGVEGAANCVLVLFWFFSIGALFSGSDDFIASLRERGRVIPVWLDVPWDAVIVGTLVWHGWWWTGVAYLLANCCLYAAWDKAEKQGFAA